MKKKNRTLSLQIKKRGRSIFLFVFSLFSLFFKAVANDHPEAGKIYISNGAELTVSNTILYGEKIVVSEKEKKNHSPKAKTTPAKVKVLEKKVHRKISTPTSNRIKIIPSENTGNAFNNETLGMKRVFVIPNNLLSLFAVILNDIVISILCLFAILLTYSYKSRTIPAIHFGHNFQRPPPSL